MTSDLLEENQDLKKQVEELKDEIATRNGKLAILISENERLKGIVLGNEEEISDLEKSCNETQELLDKQIEATYKLVEENAELEKENESLTNIKNIYIRDLLKAKEIIRDFLSVVIDYIDKEDKNYSFIAEAEQFISEVEK
jgi:DNA repair exonuclease SbcCD ATPase subunit